MKTSSVCPQPPRGSRRLLRLSIVPLFLVCAILAGLAASADDDYMRIFNGIQEADGMAKAGKTEQALAKYYELYKALQAFKKENPEWDPQVLAFRTTYVGQRIRTLSEELSKPADKVGGAREKADPAKGADAGAVQVKLLDPGAEPRTRLRLRPNPGDKQTTELRIQVSTEMKMGGMAAPVPKTPPFTLGIETTISSVSPEGDIQFDFTFVSLEVAESPETPAQVAQVLKSSLDGLKGVTGQGIISSRGESKKTILNRSDSAAKEALQSMAQPEELFSSMSVVFPDEPVGKGARWEVRRAVKSQGMTIDQVENCELASLEENIATIKASTKQSASNQKMSIPGQPGLSMTLEKLSGSGTGTSTYDLTRLMATKASAKVTSDMMTSISAQGQKQQVSIKTDVTVNLESK